MVNSKNIIHPTISNSTGDYFIATIQQNNTFNHKELICTSNKLCHIECIGQTICRYTTFNCNNASICHINCQRRRELSAYSTKYYPCQEAAIYTSPIETNINCEGVSYCKLTIYSDYDKYPSSKTTLICDGTLICAMSLLNPSTMLDNYDNITYERFKVFCTDCYYSGQNINTLATPTIVNGTGEYYFNPSSHVDFQCNHNELCYIDCQYGDCYGSNIDCGNSSICHIQCNNKNCHMLGDIIANDIYQFNVECQGWKTCDNAHFNLTNIVSINVNCSKYACSRNEYEIQNVNEISVFCGYLSCEQLFTEQWSLTDINTAIFTCEGGCYGMDLIMQNTSYTMSCSNQRYYLGCFDVHVDAIGSEIDISCISGRSCSDMNICTNDALNIDCTGYNSCTALEICNDTTAEIDINCEGEYSCIDDLIPTPRPSSAPTLIPSVSPIIITTNESDQEQESRAVASFMDWEILLIIWSVVIYKL